MCFLTELAAKACSILSNAQEMPVSLLVSTGLDQEPLVPLS